MSGNGNSNVLIAPERNNFFYGKLMDVPQFEKDYAYNLQKRLLMNRLVIGSGVIFGLDVAADISTAGNVTIQPGAAIDGLGREIIVPQQISIDPHQLTDDQGDASGDPLNSGTVLVAVVYAEIKTDMVPKLVADCSGNGKCDCNTVREGYRIIVRKADNRPPAPSCHLTSGFDSDALQKALSQRISTTVTDPSDTSVPLVFIDLSSLQNLDSSVGRSLVYGNRLLYELILCLSDRLNSVAQAHILTYISGDGQRARPTAALANPLVVQLVDGFGKPVGGQTVQFQPGRDNGTADPAAATTSDADGKAQTTWKLGDSGPQQLIASAVGSVLTVTFNATAK